MTRILVGLIRGYQFFLSPWLGSACRFYPTCSEYSKDALVRYGAAKGIWLTARRLLKCHPWHGGGPDPLL